MTKPFATTTLLGLLLFGMITVAARRPLPGCIHHSDRGSQGRFK